MNLCCYKPELMFIDTSISNYYPAHDSFIPTKKVAMLRATCQGQASGDGKLIFKGIATLDKRLVTRFLAACR